MAAGDVDCRIVEQPITTATIDTALTASIAVTGADATVAMTSIRDGEAVLICTVDIA